MKSWTCLDRRASERVAADLEITGFRDGTACAWRAVDLSVEGALVRRPNDREPPALHRVELALASGRRLRAVARTVWSRGSMHAVRFIGLDEVDRLELCEQLDRRVS